MPSNHPLAPDPNLVRRARSTLSESPIKSYTPQAPHTPATAHPNPTCAFQHTSSQYLPHHRLFYAHQCSSHRPSPCLRRTTFASARPPSHRLQHQTPRDIDIPTTSTPRASCFFSPAPSARPSNAQTSMKSLESPQTPPPRLPVLFPSSCRNTTRLSRARHRRTSPPSRPPPTTSTSAARRTLRISRPRPVRDNVTHA